MGRHPEAREFLMGYAVARQDLVRYEAEVRQLETDGCGGSPAHVQITAKLEAARARASRRLMDISETIEGMDKPLMKAVVSARYLQLEGGADLPTWADVSAKLCISRDYALKLHSGALAWLDFELSGR